MPAKRGRPPGAQNKVGKDEKEFLKGLLGDTQQQYRDAFMYYAERSKVNEDDRKFFVTIRHDISKLIVPKPVEIDATVNQTQFDRLVGLCAKWDDDVD